LSTLTLTKHRGDWVLESASTDNYIRLTPFPSAQHFTLGKRTLHLTVRHLAKAYGLLWALRDVSFDLPAGEVVALLGPNGAGKTTLLKVLAGLISPTTGEIVLDGSNFSHAAVSLRSALGFLAPSEHLYENLTVRENLVFFLSLYQKIRAISQIDVTLDEVGLKRRSKEYVSALSSGMKCRLSIAKWKLLEPGLLLLDEPYGVLDGKGVDLLENFLRVQRDKGSVIIMASHHVARVLSLCTRAVILHQGKLTFNEPHQQPWDSFTRAFGEFLPHGESWSF
jgi:heme ABC exporter ATP-binding subunit CcmA